MRRCKAKIERVELFLNQQGLVDWFIPHKLPVFDRQGTAIGVMGTVQNYELQHRLSYPYPEIEKAVAYIRTHFCESIKMADLARNVGWSVRHFYRKFKQALTIGPVSHIQLTRPTTPYPYSSLPSAP